MNKRFEEGGEMLRSLEAGESVQILDGPKNLKLPAVSCIKVKCVTDKSIGWVNKASLRRWNQTYNVRVASPLQETSSVAEDTKTIVELAKGDKVQYLEGPVADNNSIRLKVKAVKDGSIGWVTLKSEKGQLHLD